MELALGLLVIWLVLYALAKLADFFEERNFVIWLLFYLLGGALLIMLFAAARDVK